MWRCAGRLRAQRRKRLRLRPRTVRAKSLPPLLFFTDPDRTPDAGAVIAMLPRGAGVVYRAFGAADAVARGRALAGIARRRGVVFLVGADVSLAIALRADGVHFPERDAFRTARNRRLRGRFLLTGAAHDGAAARRGARTGLDAVMVSPIFPSRSPSADRALGVRALSAIVRRTTVPVYALGGVNHGTARLLLGTGVAGLAAIEGLIRI